MTSFLAAVYAALTGMAARAVLLQVCVAMYVGLCSTQSVITQLRCNSTNTVSYHDGDDLHELRLTFTAEQTICQLELVTSADRRFELDLSTLGSSDADCSGGGKSDDLCRWFGGSSACNRVVFPYASDHGWLGLEQLRPSLANLVTIDEIRGGGIDYLVSTGNLVRLVICVNSFNNYNLSLRFRTTVVDFVVDHVHQDTYHISAPWFPAGYVQAGQTYSYTFSSYSSEKITFRGVHVDFDDLNLDEGDVIQTSLKSVLTDQNRKSIYFAFDSFTTSATLKINVTNRFCRWAKTVGWTFNVRYVVKPDVPDYYDNPDTTGIMVETVTEYVNMTSSFNVGRRLTVTVDKMLDYLYVFTDLLPEVNLAVHVVIYTQTKAGLLTMEIRDGPHSQSPTVVNVSASSDLDSQPQFGYVMSSGAYIRVVSHEAQFSILTILVTPFRVQSNTGAAHDQCCQYPQDGADRGGFLCGGVMRCIPAECACDGVNNCGDKEDEAPLACGGELYDRYGMTARNRCRTDAKTVLCPWGAWVKKVEDCYSDNRPTNIPLTVTVGVLGGCLVSALLILSVCYRRRVLSARRRPNSASTQFHGALGRFRTPHQRSRNESHVPPRTLPRPTTDSRPDLRLQMGVLPPAYADVGGLGKAPPSYRQNVDANDDKISVYQNDNPPSYELAITHQKADDIPTITNAPLSGNIGVVEPTPAPMQDSGEDANLHDQSASSSEFSDRTFDENSSRDTTLSDDQVENNSTAA